jgi:hypothetical protein
MDYVALSSLLSHRIHLAVVSRPSCYCITSILLLRYIRPTIALHFGLGLGVWYLDCYRHLTVSKGRVYPLAS